MGSTKNRVTVAGVMEVRWVVELPEALCRNGVACGDPAIEAAMQGVSQELATYLWGPQKPPARVFCEVDESDVTIEDDDRS